MSKDEQAIEAEIQAKGLNAPRLTPAHIDATIVGEDFHIFAGTTMTVCALKLRNGFVVIGSSAAASPENFDHAIGRKIARENARNQIWALEGYLLRSALSASAGDSVFEHHAHAKPHPHHHGEGNKPAAVIHPSGGMNHC